MTGFFPLAVRTLPFRFGIGLGRVLRQHILQLIAAQHAFGTAGMPQRIEYLMAEQCRFHRQHAGDVVTQLDPLRRGDGMFGQLPGCLVWLPPQRIGNGLGNGTLAVLIAALLHSAEYRHQPHQLGQILHQAAIAGDIAPALRRQNSLCQIPAAAQSRPQFIEHAGQLAPAQRQLAPLPVEFISERIGAGALHRGLRFDSGIRFRWRLIHICSRRRRPTLCRHFG